MNSKFFKIISVVFHPIFIPFYTLLLFLQLPVFHIQWMSIGTRWYLIEIMGIGMILLPLVSLLILKKLGVIQSLQLEKKEERSLPYLLMFFFSAVSLYFIWQLPMLMHIFRFIIENTIFGLSILLFVNQLYKISAHLFALGSLFAVIFLVSFQLQINLLAWVIVILLVSGLVASARLLLKAHSIKEVYSGFFLGLFSTTFFYFALMLIKAHA